MYVLQMTLENSTSSSPLYYVVSFKSNSQIAIGAAIPLLY